MFLNTIKAANGSRPARKRLGRGIGSTLGKTSGKGHKGQKARAGGFHKVGFEGGQMPLQRRLPKVGFKSAKKRLVQQVRLSEINRILEHSEVIDLRILKEENIIPRRVKVARIIDSGEITKRFVISGVKITSGAKVKIEAAGGKVEV
jgi:large subunit ribosomal protein L15